MASALLLGEGARNPRGVDGAEGGCRRRPGDRRDKGGLWGGAFKRGSRRVTRIDLKGVYLGFVCLALWASASGFHQGLEVCLQGGFRRFSGVQVRALWAHRVKVSGSGRFCGL